MVSQRRWKSVGFRVDLLPHCFWHWMMSFAEVFASIVPQWFSVDPQSPVLRKACFIPARSLMSSVTENISVIFCSWRRGPYVFYITFSYFWVGEKQRLLDHSWSEITLKSGSCWILVYCCSFKAELSLQFWWSNSTVIIGSLVYVPWYQSNDLWDILGLLISFALTELNLNQSIQLRVKRIIVCWIVRPWSSRIIRLFQYYKHQICVFIKSWRKKKLIPLSHWLLSFQNLCGSFCSFSHFSSSAWTQSKTNKPESWPQWLLSFYWQLIHEQELVLAEKSNCWGVAGPADLCDQWRVIPHFVMFN